VASGSILGRNPQRSLVLALIVTGIAISVLGAFAGTPVVGFVAFTLWGLAFGALPPMLQTRMLHASSAAFRDTASALYTTAFNAGIGGGALVGAIVYGAIGVERLPWIYLGVLVLALALAVVTQAISSRRPAQRA
jgi:predicted MFS family arabinose efflux permease